MNNYDLVDIDQKAKDLRGTIKLQLKYDPQQMNPSQHLGGIGYMLMLVTYAILTKMLNNNGDAAKRTYYNWNN
jgi:hypothetical protein